MSCTTQLAKSPMSATFPPFRLRETEEWESITLPRLRTLLRQADYSKEDCAYTVQFTKQNILRPAFFGPSPSDLRKRPTWKSYLTDDHTPVEFSIDVGEKGTKVRFAIEPLSVRGDDPYNLDAPIAYLRRVQQSVPNVCMDWFTALGDKLFINEHTPNADVANAKGLTQVLCAMDFNGQAPLIKAYILLDATRKAFGEQETMTRVNAAAEEIGVGAQWTALRQYLDRARSAGRDNGARLEFISVDCVEKDKARFKPYVRFSHLTKRDFLRHVRLDQASPSPEMQAYESLCGQLWDAFCDDDDLLRVESTKDLEERTHGAIFYYEMHANSASSDIQPKVYLPVRHMLSNDAEIGKRIDDFLARQHLKPRGWYANLLEQFTTHRALHQGQGIQTMLGIALKKGKPSVSVYLNPEAFS